jgi:hypothetical protein
MNATRSLLTILSAKLGGCSLYMPSADFASSIISQIKIVKQYQTGSSVRSLAERYNITEEDIIQIISNYPTAIIPDSRELPKIKTRLCTMAESFSEYTDVSALLGEATERINRVEEIIKNLERGNASHSQAVPI